MKDDGHPSYAGTKFMPRDCGHEAEITALRRAVKAADAIRGMNSFHYNYCSSTCSDSREQKQVVEVYDAARREVGELPDD